MVLAANPAGSFAPAATIAPAVAAPAKTMARNSSPLPMNTVEKNWSSNLPRRSLATAMNQRKARPANGTRARANLNGPMSPDSQAPVSFERSPMVWRMMVELTPKSTAKMIPAMAPATGVAARRATLPEVTSGEAGLAISTSREWIGRRPPRVPAILTAGRPGAPGAGPGDSTGASAIRSRSRRSTRRRIRT